MTLMGFPILSLIIFSPLVGVVLLLFVDRQSATMAKWVTLVTSGATFIISLPLY